MASLSAGTWIGVGLLVTVVSLLLPQLRPFAVIGVIFLLVGLVKLVFSAKKTKGQDKDLYHKTSPRRDMQAHEMRKKTCFVCSAINSTEANFCGHCGHKLR